jgi:hypothetical protein
LRYPAQAHPRDIVSKENRRFQNAIGETRFNVGKSEELLANASVIRKLKIANRADTVAFRAILDRTCRDDGVPLIMTVEVAKDGPDVFERRVDDRTSNNFDHPVQREN